MDNPAITLSQFTTKVGNAIRVQPELNRAWVMAELSDVRTSGGHCYMELIEKSVSGQTVAKMRANIWSSTFNILNRKFFEATGRPISSNLKVLVQGSATHHNLYGLSMNITDIDPTYTLGDLERLRREILERLQREGVLNHNKSLPLPEAPQRIAVISAAGAAGYGDFTDQLSTNPQGFVFYPHLFGAVMQGDRTSSSVRDALKRIEMTIDLWDCVVIIRGGGSTSDLNGFDDYELAKAVATFPLPIIVGIGHERDRCVLDEIAAVRCKTPTAVASYLNEILSSAWTKADTLMRNIAQYATDRMAGEHRRLDMWQGSIPSMVVRSTSNAKDRLETFARMMVLASQNVVQNQNVILTQFADKLSRVASMPIERQNLCLESAERLIRVLSPENTLKRGYSVTRFNGHAVTDVSEIPDGAVLETRLFHGSVTSTVNK